MKNKNIIFYIICLVLITFVMFYWIDKKKGFHEDEVFSYGASNCDDSNVYQAYGGKDPDNEIFLDKNPLKTVKNVIYYNINKDKFEKIYNEIKEAHHSVWRSREEAIEYLTLDKDELFNYFIVYYNTGEDVHPPLFYFAVHFMSSFMIGHFSKYIIFIVNLVFLILTCYMIRKILNILKKDYLILPTTILYGFSMGAISTVMFQRMYMMLTFFTLWFLYVNLKIYFNEFEIDKKIKFELCSVTILGFLTHYYFCIYAAIVTCLMIIFMISQKEKQKLKTYIFQFIKSAIIGILVFVPCIYQIFFSYRGIRAPSSGLNFIEKVYYLIKSIFLMQFSSKYIGVIVTIVLISISILKFKLIKDKKLVVLIFLPVIIYFFIVSKLIPFKVFRYIMNILPLISIIILLIIDKIFINRKQSVIIIMIFSIIISIFANFTNEPEFLYPEYEEYMNIANENKDDKFVFVCDTVFVHLRNIGELMTYEESLMIMPEDVAMLKDDEKLKNEDEFILSIQKRCENESKILEEVKKNTGFKNHKLLLDDNKRIDCKIYKISK